jgi:hypothetical protein
MAGKQTYEKTRTNKAYAEGRTARATGAASATNPWLAAFSEENLAWADGYSAVDGTTDDTAYSGVTGLPAVTMKDGIDPVNHWPKGALKQLLDELHIAYPADASITDLANLVPDTHQHHIKEEAPAHTWSNAQVVAWLEKEGANVPPELKDNTAALFEMVYDVIKLKAGQPLSDDPLPPLDESL